MAKSNKAPEVTVETVDDDDENGTAKNDDQNVDIKPQAAKGSIKRALELAETDGEEFTGDNRVLRAVSLVPIDQKATDKLDANEAAEGLPKGEETVLDFAVRTLGKRSFLTVVTNNYRKFTRIL